MRPLYLSTSEERSFVFFFFLFCISSSFLSFLPQHQLIMAQNESLKMTSIVAAGETSSRSSSKLRDEADLARVGKRSVLKVRRSKRCREWFHKMLTLTPAQFRYDGSSGVQYDHFNHMGGSLHVGHHLKSGCVQRSSNTFSEPSCNHFRSMLILPSSTPTKVDTLILMQGGVAVVVLQGLSTDISSPGQEPHRFL